MLCRNSQGSWHVPADSTAGHSSKQLLSHGLPFSRTSSQSCCRLPTAMSCTPAPARKTQEKVAQEGKSLQESLLARRTLPGHPNHPELPLLCSEKAPHNDKKRWSHSKMPSSTSGQGAAVNVHSSHSSTRNALIHTQP